MVQYQTMTFPRQALEDYADPERRESVFPSSHRFKACHPETGKMTRVGRSHYFSSLYVARHLLAQGLEVWQERYKLSKVKQSRHIYYRCNCELTDRLGPDIKRRIEEEADRLGHEFRDPDLVTYDPASGQWQFIEIKRADTGDTLSDEQKNSLELLERVVPNAMSIVLTLSPESS